IGTLSSAIIAGLERDGRSLLGGDIEFRLTHRPAEPDERAFLAGQGRLSESVQMRVMGHAERSQQSVLVEMKAVGTAYPLYGRMELENGHDLQAVLQQRNGIYGAAVDPQALIRLDAAIGDRISLGEATFEIRAVIAREPDRATAGFTLGPRVMIALDGVPA